MRYILLFILSLTALPLSAQVSGYLGKRNYVKADAAFIWTLGQWFDFAGLRSGYEFSEKGITFDSRIGLQAGHVVSRNEAFTLGLGLLKTNAAADAFTPSVNYPFENDRLDYHELNYQLSGKTIAFGYTKFKTKKGALAPLGTFQAFHLQATFLSPEITNEEIKYGYVNYPKEYTEASVYKSTFWAFGWEFGQNFIVKDLLLINYGFQINVPLDLKRLLDVKEGYSPETSSYESIEAYNEDIFKQRTFNRMLEHDLFQLHLGLGVIF